MFTPAELESFSTLLDERTRQLEQEVMSDIIRRIKINGEITRAADWQINRLHEIGLTRDEIMGKVQKALKLSDEDMQKMYTGIIEEGYAHDEALYKAVGAVQIPFDKNLELQQLIAATAVQTAETMYNISQSLGFAVKKADGSLEFLPIAEYYQTTIDNAVMGISSGTFDYNTAIKKAVSEMTNSGLRTIDYATGWQNRVDVAARRAIMTGITQLTGKTSEQNAKALGTDVFEVTWHGGARPTHQVWQGKWYTMEQLKTVCGYGTGAGLKGWNCRHDFFAVIPGISQPTYTAEQLSEMNRKENTPVEYCGKKYTAYEATQRQRKLETTMRAQRQKIKLLKDGGANEEDIINARCKYRGLSQEYAAFSKHMELPQQRQRVTVDGLGNIGVGKWKSDLTGEGNRRILKEKIANGEITLALNPEKQRPHMFGSLEYDESKNKSYFTISEEQLQEIVNVKHSNGIVRISKKGQIKETIVLVNDIGVNVNPISGESLPTNRFTVHYSKQRTHCVPSKKEG